MSYNTWPTFAGRGWNIKKRPITKTIIETADGGQEFRLARFQNPLYEFDVEIPYLSQADYATLQNFFAQQGGPFTPFLFYPDNEAAAATPFFTGDGVTTQATLLMPDGSPALFANSGATPTVSAVHQTDWQGRIALSNQARNNQIVPSTPVYPPAGAWFFSRSTQCTVTTGVADPQGGTTALSFINNTLAGSPGPYYRASVPAAGTYSFSVWAKGATGDEFLSLQFEGVTPAPAIQLTTAWKYYAVSITVPVGTTGKSWSALLFGDAAMSAACPVGGGMSITFFVEDSSGIGGAYIPTTTAPVTVTDYTQAGNQITFGQVPAVGATEDWDGTYAYLVRFKDDQIEMTQTMSQIYEATTVSLRSVR